MIEGVQVTPLKKISNPLGDVFHALKATEKSFHGFGEAYFSTVRSGQTKGWKRHKKMILNLVVPVGTVKFVIYDDREESKTKGKFFEVTLSLSNYSRLTVPPGVWMAFQGKDTELNLLLNVASIPHDPDEADSKELEEIRYGW